MGVPCPSCHLPHQGVLFWPWAGPFPLVLRQNGGVVVIGGQLSTGDLVGVTGGAPLAQGERILRSQHVWTPVEWKEGWMRERKGWVERIKIYCQRWWVLHFLSTDMNTRLSNYFPWVLKMCDCDMCSGTNVLTVMPFSWADSLPHQDQSLVNSLGPHSAGPGAPTHRQQQTWPNKYKKHGLCM